MALLETVDAGPLLADVVARRARGLLAENQMTQAQLAKRLGFSAASMSDRLRGVKDFDLNELPALAEALETSVAYLLGMTEVRAQLATAAPAAGARFLAAVESTEGQPVSAGPLGVVHPLGLEPRTRCLRDSPAASVIPIGRRRRDLSLPQGDAAGVLIRFPLERLGAAS